MKPELGVEPTYVCSPFLWVSSNQPPDPASMFIGSVSGGVGKYRKSDSDAGGSKKAKRPIAEKQVSFSPTPCIISLTPSRPSRPPPGLGYPIPRRASRSVGSHPVSVEQHLESLELTPRHDTPLPPNDLEQSRVASLEQDISKGKRLRIGNYHSPFPQHVEDNENQAVDGNFSCPFRKRKPLRFNIRDYVDCAAHKFLGLPALK